jgi:hypothetical protein
LTLFRVRDSEIGLAPRAARLAVIAAALACGCGPVAATSVIADAEVALERAHASEGGKYALYETTLADLYLVKAREEQGHARYSDAAELAADALKFAEAAARKAAEHRTAAPGPSATIQHPAGGGPATVVAPPPVPPEKVPVVKPVPPAQPAPEKPPGKQP